MFLKRTFPDDLISRSHEVKIYPTEPWSDGIAVMEYVVLNKAFGDFETVRWRPRGTVKSRIAVRKVSAWTGEEALDVTVGRAGQVCVEVVLVPTGSLVVTS